MTDQKPPRCCGVERETLIALLRYQRDSLCRKVEGVPDDAARTSAVPSGTTMLWLIRHMTRAEALWVLARFAGRTGEVPGETVAPDDSMSAAVATYRATCDEVDRVVASHELDAEALPEGDLQTVNLRWIVMHLLEETARHAGHADILRELFDGQIGR